MNRRTLSAVRILALGALAVTLLSSCFLLDFLGEDPVTVAQRIAGFQDELNSADRSGTYLLFHDVLTADYESIKAATFWDAPFPAVQTGEAPYLITTTDASDTSAVLVTIDGPVDTFFGPKDYKLVMGKDVDDNWMIVWLYLTTDSGATWTAIVQ